jgi:hypothetical protein
MDALIAVAISVGIDALNPEGGLRSDASDDVIIETVTDIAQGYPHYLTVNLDRLSEVESKLIVSGFFRGMSDGAVNH